MKKGLALCGGGSLGVYELGAWKALRELGYDFDIITGTSIGALNGAMIVQDDYEKLYDLWSNLKIDKIMNNGFDIEEVNIRKIIRHSDFKTFLASYVKRFGGDIKPFKEMINYYLDCDKIRNSDKTIGVVVTQFPTIRKVEMVLNDLSNEDMFNYILASASCFPVFPICKINGKQYIDGGYNDNLPIDFNLKLGASSVIAIDLKPYVTHKEYLNNPLIDYIYPKWDLGSFLYFDETHLERNRLFGYYDVMKYYNKYDGFRYTFNKTKKYDKIANKLVNEIMKDIIYFNTNKKKNYIKMDNYSNIFDYLNKHIFKKATNYDYFIKSLEEIALIYEISPKEVYDIESLISLIKKEIPKFKYSTIGEEFILLDSDGKKREFINKSDKRKFINFISNVKFDYDNRILLLQSNIELYLSLIFLELKL